MPSQDFTAVLSHQDHIFEANTAHTRNIGARFQGDHHARFQLQRVVCHDARLLMISGSEAVAGVMGIRGIPRILDGLPKLQVQIARA